MGFFEAPRPLAYTQWLNSWPWDLWDLAISPTEVRQLTGLKDILVKKFARQGSWENLLQYTLDFDESVVFNMIYELVKVTEEAIDNALFQSEDLLRSIKDCSKKDVT